MIAYILGDLPMRMSKLVHIDGLCFFKIYSLFNLLFEFLYRVKNAIGAGVLPTMRVIIMSFHRIFTFENAFLIFQQLVYVENISSATFISHIKAHLFSILCAFLY